ncbi:mannosyl-oligosaccharide 1,2-alpha-mannosidase [Lachancea thermotolerans CBS 6340]|uniref:alpha-1,2-Mannosidase n=1 Tax=Lachancea thermotolerans (strain ATCC 56472 / CBS 6340 / NRRL Y-8284) TaxID=559295 RepID=C5DFU0_LACTC|nr:KLTH0D17908p [Lachancea thermotolerans CBS 6340]CAR23045.1 KLTH0D17908p [Lachancea thermotolerans CBS 6340]
MVLFKGIGASIAIAAYLLFLYYSLQSSSYKRTEIEATFLQAWKGYAAHGWDADIYGPLSKTTSNMYGSKAKPLGWIIIDSIDTMLLMYNSTTSSSNKNLFKHELVKVESWVTRDLDYDIDASVSLFETTIRMLGGLLSAYYLSNELLLGDPTVYLNKAKDLADRMLPAFNTSTGIPYSSINLHTGASQKNHVDEGASSTAEFTTLQLEFKYLSAITADNRYWKAVEKAYKPLYEQNDLIKKYKGLVSIYTYPDTGTFRGSNIRLGSRGDSFYEYLLKQYLQTHERIYYDLYRVSVEGIKENLLSKSNPSGLTYIGEKERGLSGPLSSKMDHLVCFMGGLLAMGATEGLPISEARNQQFWDQKREEDWTLAQELTYTCYQMYHQVPSGLAPEIVVFNDKYASGIVGAWQSADGDFFIKPADSHNLQRPETVESIMFLYHLTKEQKYRDWGWEIFQSFRRHSGVNCKKSDTECAYTSITNVLSEPPSKGDNMESFWLAETLKYLHLLFQDDVDLTGLVFNTEAHPFPVIPEQNLKAHNLVTGWHL